MVDVLRGQRKLETLIGHATEIFPLLRITRLRGNTGIVQHVARVFEVVVGGQGDAAFEKIQVKAHVVLVGRFPFQPGISRIGDGHAVIQAAVGSVITRSHLRKVGVRGDPVIARNTRAGADLKVIDRLDLLHKSFLVDAPSYSQRREITDAVVFGEIRGTVDAHVDC